MDWKKMHNLEVENYVLFSALAEDLSPGDSLSDISDGLFWRGKEGTKIYRRFCKRKQNAKQKQVVEHENITAD